MAEPELLTLRDAAAYLRVSPMTVRRMVRSGRLASGRVGANGALRFTRAALDAAVFTPAHSHGPDGARSSLSRPHGVEEREPPIEP